MASFEFIALILTGLGLTASIVYYSSVLSNANKTQQQQLETRQAALFSQIYNKFEEVEFTKNHTEVMKWSFKDYNEWKQ